MHICVKILKEMNLISLGSFAFLVHVLIRKLQDLDRMPNQGPTQGPSKNSQQEILIFPLHTKSHVWFIYQGDILTRIDWA